MPSDGPAARGKGRSPQGAAAAPAAPHVPPAWRNLALTVVGAAFLTVFLTGFHALVDPDVWFHLRAGKEMTQTGHFLRSDTFSYPSAGRPYVDLHWLFQVVLFQVYRLGGEAALVWFACLVLLLTYFVLFRLARRRAPPALAAAFVALGIIVASERLSPRPEIFSFLGFAWVQWLAQRHQEGGRRAWMFIPLVMLFWVNAEGLFILGYLILAAHILDRPRDRKLWAALGLSVGVSLINPYFVEGALHPLVLFTRINQSLPIYSQTIGEFLSPFRDKPLHPSVIVYPFYLGAIGLGLLVRGRWPRRSEIVLLAATVYLSLTARRNLGLLPLAATPILAGWWAHLGQHRWVGRLWRKRPQSLRHAAPAAAMGLALAAMLWFDLGLVTERVYWHAESHRVFGTGSAPVAFARGAARYLRDNQVSGPIFSSFAAGSYFIWAYPQEKVFIDGRLEVHTPQHYERYLRMIQGTDIWTAAEREFGFNVLVIQQTGGQEPILDRILQEEAWAPVFLDATAIVFLRRNEANQALIERDFLTGRKMREMFPSITAEEVDAGLALPNPTNRLARIFKREHYPWNQLYLGQTFLTINRWEMGLAQFVNGIRSAPDAGSLRLLAAMTLNLLERPARALEALDGLAKTRPPSTVRAQAAAARGDALTALGRTDEAIRAYDEYMRRPFREAQIPSVLANRALARLRSGDIPGASADVQESLRRDQSDPLAFWVLGMVEEAQGRREAALRAYARFQQLGGRSPEVDAAVARLRGQ